jgi:hypothetical protein
MPDNVIIRFKQPSSKVKSLPSESLNLALNSLADADELEALMCQASATGRALAFDVYQNRQGQPFLINIRQEEQ